MVELLEDPVVMYAARLALSLILLTGAVHKLFDRQRFGLAVAGYAVLPAPLVPVVAWFVPVVEGLAGTLLLQEAFNSVGVAIAVLLIAFVTAPLLINLVRGRTDIDCGCGVSRHGNLSWALPVRNAGLLVLAWLACGPVDARAMEWLDYLSVSFAGLSVLTLYHAANELLANHPSVTSLRRSTR